VQAGIPDELQAVSVTVKADNCQGSGTLVTRKIGNDNISFIWTAGHVVAGLRGVRTVIIAGNTKTIIEYKDAEVVQEMQEDGRRVGEVKYDAKIVKVTDASYGEDLALLMVRKYNAYPQTACVKFKLDKQYIPPIGVSVVHVGSLLGQFGANSFTNGLVSQTGRLLPGEGAEAKVFDQTTVTAFPGSSGGGVFLAETGEYIGMLTQGVQQLQGFNFIVPIRRIHKWAWDSKIEWALDPSISGPPIKDIESMPVEDISTIENSHKQPED
jgi:hypothetical protein